MEAASLCINICVGLPVVFFADCLAYVETLTLVKFVSVWLVPVPVLI